jgi:hypothetical protein
VVLDPRPGAGLPGGLEVVAGPVHGQDQGHRQRTEVHGRPPRPVQSAAAAARQLERITKSFRSTVRKPQPSRAAGPMEAGRGHCTAPAAASDAKKIARGRRQMIPVG